MEIDTGAYQGLAAQVAALEARVDALSEGLALAYAAAGPTAAGEAYRLGLSAGRRRERLEARLGEPGDGPRGRHLRAVE